MSRVEALYRVALFPRQTPQNLCAWIEVSLEWQIGHAFLGAIYAMRCWEETPPKTGDKRREMGRKKMVKRKKEKLQRTKEAADVHNEFGKGRDLARWHNGACVSPGISRMLHTLIPIHGSRDSTASFTLI